MWWSNSYWHLLMSRSFTAPFLPTCLSLITSGSCVNCSFPGVKLNILGQIFCSTGCRIITWLKYQYNQYVTLRLTWRKIMGEKDFNPLKTLHNDGFWEFCEWYIGHITNRLPGNWIGNHYKCVSVSDNPGLWRLVELNESVPFFLLHIATIEVVI